MTIVEEKILNKAIKRAINRGWDIRGFSGCELTVSDGDIHGVRLVNESDSDLTVYLSVCDLIFSHDFAIAVWGEIPACSNCGSLFSESDVVCTAEKCVLNGHTISGLPLFKFHLQQMVIQENTIKYLGLNI